MAPRREFFRVRTMSETDIYSPEEELTDPIEAGPEYIRDDETDSETFEMPQIEADTAPLYEPTGDPVLDLVQTERGGEEWNLAFSEEGVLHFDRDAEKIFEVATGAEWTGNDPESLAAMIAQWTEGGDPYIPIPDYKIVNEDSMQVFEGYYFVKEDGAMGYNIFERTVALTTYGENKYGESDSEMNETLAAWHEAMTESPETEPAEEVLAEIEVANAVAVEENIDIAIIQETPIAAPPEVAASVLQQTEGAPSTRSNAPEADPTSNTLLREILDQSPLPKIESLSLVNDVEKSVLDTPESPTIILETIDAPSIVPDAREERANAATEVVRTISLDIAAPIATVETQSSAVPAEAQPQALDMARAAEIPPMEQKAERIESELRSSPISIRFTERADIETSPEAVHGIPESVREQPREQSIDVPVSAAPAREIELPSALRDILDQHRPIETPRTEKPEEQIVRTVEHIQPIRTIDTPVQKEAPKPVSESIQRTVAEIAERAGGRLEDRSPHRETERAQTIESVLAAMLPPLSSRERNGFAPSLEIPGVRPSQQQSWVIDPDDTGTRTSRDGLMMIRGARK